jgi:hypothetical protein
MLTFFAALSANEQYLLSPHSNEKIELDVKPGQWECPKCRYKNDSRIRYCGMCGAERQ